MTTLGSLTPKGERKKPLVDGLQDCYAIQVDADEDWDTVGVNFVGKRPVVGVALDYDDIERLIDLLRQGQEMMKKPETRPGAPVSVADYHSESLRGERCGIVFCDARSNLKTCPNCESHYCKEHAEIHRCVVKGVSWSCGIPGCHDQEHVKLCLRCNTHYCQKHVIIKKKQSDVGHTCPKYFTGE